MRSAAAENKRTAETRIWRNLLVVMKSAQRGKDIRAKMTIRMIIM